VDPPATGVVVDGSPSAGAAQLHLAINKPAGSSARKSDEAFARPRHRPAPRRVARGLIPWDGLDRESEGFAVPDQRRRLLPADDASRYGVAKHYLATVIGEVESTLPTA